MLGRPTGRTKGVLPGPSQGRDQGISGLEKQNGRGQGDSGAKCSLKMVELHLENTIWLFNIAMENPLKMEVLMGQMVYVLIINYNEQERI